MTTLAPTLYTRTFPRAAGWLRDLILIVLGAGVYFIVQTVRESAQAATAPFAGVQQANQALQTQVSQLMNPTPTVIPDPVTYINEVRALARLRGGRPNGEIMISILVVSHGGLAREFVDAALAAQEVRLNFDEPCESTE